jgi:glyoxylase-like metal-dependent hydrolase (beta-lactamase superfamily II)
MRTAYARLAALFALACAPAWAAAAERPFEKVYCLQYATLVDYPLDRILFGAPRDQTLDAPFAMCVAKRGSDLLVMDSGYVNQELGATWGTTDYVDYGALFSEIGLSPDQVTHVTLSHLHWDHAGGTERFPKAKFIIQTRELEYAAGALPQNSMARVGFDAADVLQLVKLNWEDRVILVDGDREGLLPGVDVYLTPGHTIGTMTVCVDTRKGRVCYTSDAVYTYKNIHEDIPLGLALDASQAVESYKKIRRLLRGGVLIPGHEPALFRRPADFGFRRVSEHAIAVVE